MLYSAAEPKIGELTKQLEKEREESAATHPALELLNSQLKAEHDEKLSDSEQMKLRMEAEERNQVEEDLSSTVAAHTEDIDKHLGDLDDHKDKLSTYEISSDDADDELGNIRAFASAHSQDLTEEYKKVVSNEPLLDGEVEVIEAHLHYSPGEFCILICAFNIYTYHFNVIVIYIILINIVIYVIYVIMSNMIR